ncbi:MAG: SRPBCC family protein [Litoreibacter sp.]
MKFSTKEDIEIGIDDVFTMLSDFDGYERAMMRQGIDIARTDTLSEKRVGASWRAAGVLRGKRRVFDIEMFEYDRPSTMKFRAISTGIETKLSVELVELSRNRTRMRVQLDIKPKTLPARLLIQSARLTRNTLNRRFNKRIANFAEDMEDRHARELRA